MSLLKDLGAAAMGLLVFFAVSGAYVGDDEPSARFDPALFDSTLYAPRTMDTAELGYDRDSTPADRVGAVFARFVPGEGRLVKRYASAAGIIR